MPTHIDPTDGLSADALLARLRAHVERVVVTGERSGMRQMVEDFQALDRLCTEGLLPAAWANDNPDDLAIDPIVREQVIAVIKRALRGTVAFAQLTAPVVLSQSRT